MQWSKVKTIVLLILALVNVVLLVLVGGQELTSVRYQEEARTQAVALLEKNGIRFLPQIPEDLQGVTLDVERARMDTGEDAMAMALLGESEKVAQSEDIQISYTSPLGSADFYSSGRFNFTFTEGAYLLGEGGNYKEHAAQLLEELSYQGQWARTTVEGEEITVVFRQLWEEEPIFSCEIAFTYEGNVLKRIDAQYLAGTAQKVEGDELRTTATILVQFLGGMNDGTVSICTEIQEMTWGYRANLTRPVTVLEPIWYIVTDTGAYYMDGVTGAIEQAG